MTILERRMIEVDGTTLEIFVSGDHGPVICEAHPYGGYRFSWVVRRSGGPEPAEAALAARIE